MTTRISTSVNPASGEAFRRGDGLETIFGLTSPISINKKTNLRTTMRRITSDRNREHHACQQAMAVVAIDGSMARLNRRFG
jgi:hypothetical protein